MLGGPGQSVEVHLTLTTGGVARSGGKLFFAGGPGHNAPPCTPYDIAMCNCDWDDPGCRMQNSPEHPFTTAGHE